MTDIYQDVLSEQILNLENKVDELEFELQDAREDARVWQEAYDKLRQEIDLIKGDPNVN